MSGRECHVSPIGGSPASGPLLRRPAVRLPCVLCSELLFVVSDVVLGFSFIGKIPLRVILSSESVWWIVGSRLEDERWRIWGFVSLPAVVDSRV